MPVKKSAFKRLHQSKKRAEKNRGVKDNIDYLTRHAHKEIEANNREKAWEFVYKSQKAVDKAIEHGVLKKNTGARKKSRLMKKFNALR